MNTLSKIVGWGIAAFVGLGLLTCGPARATIFTYDITCCTWSGQSLFLNPPTILQQLGVSGVFSYNTATLTALAPPPAPDPRRAFIMGPDTVLKITSGPYTFALDPSLAPVTLILNPQLGPLLDSFLTLDGRFTSSVLPPGTSDLLHMSAIKFSGAISAGTDLVTQPLDFSFADISIQFQSIGFVTANGGFHPVPEPSSVGALAIGLVALWCLRRRRCLNSADQARLGFNPRGARDDFAT